MADSRDLLVRILGDDRSLQQAFTRTERRTRQFESRTTKLSSGLTRAFGAAGIALGTAAFFKGLGDSIKAASDLNEEVSKSRQIFGDASSAVEAWSEQTARSIGVARVEALSATGTFGNLFQTVGLGQEPAADMSQSLVQLAADLASFNNADVSDVLSAIRSGLVGEAEPLRRYGVLLSEVRVQQAAMAATGKTNVKELTNQEKALARYNIILSDTVTAQGDFARTQDGLANQSKILRAQLSDLSAELGEKLLPAVVGVTSAANDLFDAFESGGGKLKSAVDLQPSDLAGLELARARIAAMKGEGDLLVQTLDQIIERLQKVQPLRPDARGGMLGVGAITASNAKVDAENADRAAKEALRNEERSRKRFAGFLKGLGLKLDRAGLTSSLDDDLAVLQEIERAIKKRIRAEGRTFELVSQLTDVQLQIASNVERQQADAQSRQDDAVARAAEKQQKALEARQERIEREAERRRRQVERRQEKQFEALSLTSEGDKRVPGVGALRKRLGNLRQSVEGTVLDTQKTDKQLDRIAKVLSGKFGKVGKEVREAILQMFNDISGALGEGDKKVGPLTKTSSLNSKKMLAGIGLSPEEIRELRGRLSNFNSAGMGNAGANNNRSTGGFTGGTGFVIENNVTVAIDGQKFSAVVTKQQQKQKRRNPKQKRGPNRNR